MLWNLVVNHTSILVRSVIASGVIPLLKALSYVSLSHWTPVKGELDIAFSFDSRDTGGLEAGCPQHLACLGSSRVSLCCLTDGDGPESVIVVLMVSAYSSHVYFDSLTIIWLPSCEHIHDGQPSVFA